MILCNVNFPTVEEGYVGTVRDFKKHMLQVLGVQKPSDFWTITQRRLWDKLSRLGWNNRTKEPEDCEDVDASAPLDEAEWNTLEVELKALH
jgi:hypothetical protein